MAKVTQHLSKQIKVKKSCNRLYLWQLCVAVVFLYTPGMRNVEESGSVGAGLWQWIERAAEGTRHG